MSKKIITYLILTLLLFSNSFAQAGGRSSQGVYRPTNGFTAALGGLADDGLAKIPINYNSGFTVPIKGSTYTDSIFGTVIRKVTDYDDATESFSQEYSPHSAFNVNNSYLLVIGTSGGGYKVINPTTGVDIRSLGISSSAECYWSISDPEIIYYHTSNLLKKYTVNTNTHSTVATFNGTGGLPNCTSITFGGGDVDLSEDGDYIPIFCAGTSYGLYKFSTDEATPTFLNFSATSENVLWCEATPDNNVLCRLNTNRNLTGTTAIANLSTTVTGTGTSFTTEVTKGAYVVISTQRKYVTAITDDTHFTVNTAFTTTASGQTAAYSARMILYDKNMNFIRGIAPFGGHASSGRDVDGKEILLIDGANDPVGGVCASNGIYKYILSTGVSSCALALPDFNLTGHLSFSNHRGHDYALISYYDGRVNPATGTAILPGIIRSDWADAGVWKKYYNEIILFKVGGTPEIRRMAHMRTGITAFSSTDSHYWFSGRANLSKTFSSRGYPTQFIFASNMRNNLRHKNLTGTFATTATSANITGVGSDLSGLAGQATIGGEFTINAETKFLQTITSDTTATTSATFTNTNVGLTATSWHPDSGIEAFVGTIDSLTLSDFTAPTQSSISSGTPAQTTATITWTNSEAATCQVEYGTTTFYATGISTFSKTTTTSCSIGLSGLTANTLYHYRVKSRDTSGNIKLSSDQTFTTAP